MNKRIFLIDDDKDDAELFQDALEEVDSTATLVYLDDAKLALEQLINRTIQLPQMIFLDINMPSISGWDCLKEIKKHDDLKSIPVIMYSTSSHKKDSAIALELGAAAFLTKPYDFNVLKKNIKNFLNKF